jgi:hypothetical protein
MVERVRTPLEVRPVAMSLLVMVMVMVVAGPWV